MAMSSVQVPLDSKQQGPSALENAAKILGLGLSLGNTVAAGYDTFVNKPAAIAAQNNVLSPQKYNLQGLPDPKLLGR